MIETSSSATEASKRLRSHALVAVGAGAAVVPGDVVHVFADIVHVELVRAIAAEAYDAGAALVDVEFSDRVLRRTHVAAAPDAWLGWAPPWRLARAGALRHGSAAIAIVDAGDPEMFAAISEARVGAANEVELEQAYMTAALSGEVKWTVIPAATSTWARNLGCQLGELELLLDQALRLDEPDPVESWRARVSELELRAAWITGAGFQALRLFGGGTDLELSLHRDTRWLTAAHSAPGASVSNLPTEEIFTSPDGGSATGTVRAAGPVVVGDTEVEDLILRFDRGRLIALSASAGQSSLENRLGTDAGASIVGEVALVDGGSRVGDLDVLFHNTLLDENAGCHIALGQGFPAARSSGAPPNQSAIHVDITLGCKELQVDAVDADGLTVTLLQEGCWLR